MAKTRQQKETTQAKFQSLLGSSKAIVFVTTDGLTVKDVTSLRRTLRAESVAFVGMKKSLFKRALAEAQFDAAPLDTFRGGVTVASSEVDEMQPAALLNKFAKTHKTVKFLGGYLNGQWMDAVAVKNLAQLPSKAELLAKLVYTLSGPMRGLVSVFSGPTRGLVQVLRAKSEQTS